MTGAQQVVFPFLLLVLPIVAALAWWLKRRYAAAVVRLQRETHSSEHPGANADDGPAPEKRSSHTPPPRLELHVQPAHTVTSGTDAVGAIAAPRRLRRRVLLVHFAGDLSYWCGLLLLAAAAFASPASALTILMMVGRPLLPVLLVPAGVAWALQAGVHRRLMNITSIAILVIGFGLILSEGDWSSELGFSFGFASIALMVSAFLRPSIRGAGLPLVISAIAGWMLLSVLFALGVALDPSPDDAVASYGELGVGVVLLLLMLAAAVWSGWRTLMALSNRYAAKRFSDVQLSLGAYWALMTMFMVGSVLKEQNPLEPQRFRLEWACLAIVLLWLLWRWLLSMMLRLVVRPAGASIGALLFLRVFKPSARTEEFTDRFFAYWRFAAPVWMIAGPDLAGAYMEPNEFFAYLRGRLREHFVGRPDEAAARIEALDSARDPDGRFRVNEVYCTDDTWRPAVLRMMSRAGAILLDLREYSRERQGTRYELTELLRRAPLDRVLVLVNAKDDVAHLATEIDAVWREVSAGRSEGTETLGLRVLQFRTGNNAEMHGLFRATVRAATGGVGASAGAAIAPAS